MAVWVEQNWILLVAALLLVILALWWVLTSSRRGRVEIERDEAVPDAPVRRNQALIDTPPAAPLRDLPIAPVVPVVPVGEPEAAIQPAIRPEAAPPPAQPAAAPDAPAPAPTIGDDDLTRIKGLGPKLAEQLHRLGVTGFAQIAAWDEADIDRIDADLGRFKGRIRRDNWVEQARFLATGDVTGYETRFGKL